MSSALETIHSTDIDQIKRFKSAKTVQPLNIDPINQEGTFKGSSTTPYNTTLFNCTCRDFIIRRQPCKHIYRLALELGTITLDDYKDNLNEVARSIPSIKDIKYKKKLKANVASFVVVDLETTGLSAGIDQIIEIGAIKVVNGQIVDTFVSLINPGMPIPQAASKVNHITDQMVANQPRFKDILPTFIAFIEGLPLVAHNAPFDGKFIAIAFMEANETLTNQVIDTLSISRKLFPDSPNHKLGTLKKYLKLKGTASHRALDDAYVTYLLYMKCFELETGSVAGPLSPAPQENIVSVPTTFDISPEEKIITAPTAIDTTQEDAQVIQQTSAAPRSLKHKYIAILLCVFFGYFGVHRLYTGKKGTALLYLFTGGLLGIGIVFDLILLISNQFTDKDGLILR